MEQINIDHEECPILLLPRSCTKLETNCDLMENVYIDLNITSPDTEGNLECIFSGFCNVKIVDKYYMSMEPPISRNEETVLVTDDTQAFNYNQSHVWIDPSRSPYVYNSFDENSSDHCSDINTNNITVEQHNTYITQNVFKYNETTHFTYDEFEPKKIKRTNENQNVDANVLNLYEEDEFECGVFLSQLSEEIMNEQENKAREERQFNASQSDNSALKQLMSTNVEPTSKQQKTILFLGDDSNSGHTIQSICINDPYVECVGSGEVESEVVIENSESPPIRQKRYQCDKCKQIFVQISAFRQHIVSNHKSLTIKHNQVPFLCIECGKYLKNKEKFQQHLNGHGDPELECSKCHKVYASKFTLKAHRKLHNRKFPCNICTRSYATAKELKRHSIKVHFLFPCEFCPYNTTKYAELKAHKESHIEEPIANLGEVEIETSNINVPFPEESHQIIGGGNASDDVRDADSVIAKVMSNEIFLLNPKKARQKRKNNKACEVCYKAFDRISDLKRHLIEHVIRSTLAKTPVSKRGTLHIQCEVCQTETFSKIDSYKAHLREHAKLTIYKCTFCDKSFSDSSNFSKHKKIHATTTYQCDICLRKFHSKKMIAKHMEYHFQNPPTTCRYCGKMFHFTSMLNKHIKLLHINGYNQKYRCKFCNVLVKSLKEKWDHEWSVHKVRKAIVDCLFCGLKFRKYSELKRHCCRDHNTRIPKAKEINTNSG